MGYFVCQYNSGNIIGGKGVNVNNRKGFPTNCGNSMNCVYIRRKKNR